MRHVSSALRLAVVLLFTVSSVLSAVKVAAQSGSQSIPSPERRLTAHPSASEPRVALAGSVTERPATSTSLGHLPAGTRLDGMSLIIKRTAAQEAELNQLLRDQQDSHSPSYHHWLTPQAFGDRFGLAPADLEVLTTWLRAQGFEVAEIAPSRNRIVFSGTAAQVESAFSVTLGRYRRDKQDFFENAEPVRLPQSLAAVMSGVTGLSSYRLQSHALSRGISSFAPQYTPSTGGFALVPWDFRQLYDVNPLIDAGSDGTGVKIGVIGQSAFSSIQVADFQLKTGQPTRLPTAVLVPNTGVSNLVAGDEDESEIDLEYASGTAPGASVQFIYTGCGTAASSAALPGTANCNNEGVMTSLIYAITNNLAPILTFSYGACETEIAASATGTLEPMLQQANAQGQTVLVSSGDSGAATCDQGFASLAATHGLTVSYPASSVYVTAVGGTQLSNNGFSSTNNSYGGSATSYNYEQAWNDTSSLGTLAASGGGVSKVFAKPDWQTGTYVPQDGFRDVPDVAFAASVLNVPYFACTAEASCQANTTIGGTRAAPNGGLYGGTSLSAPNFAAMLAVIEQKNSSGPLGNINPLLYALAEDTSAATVFHDVGTGDNLVPCVLGTPDCGESNLYHQIGYRAAGGYDQVTGLGSISGTGLATALSANTPVVGLAVSPTVPIVDQPVTFSSTVTIPGSNPAPTGSVTFSIDGTAVGPAVPLTNGAASFAYSGFTSPSSPSGYYFSVTATYSGDSTYATSSANLSLVAAQVPVKLTIASPTTPLQSNTATSLTITATGQYGTPAGYVLLQDNGIYITNTSSPIPLVNGVATYSFGGFSSAGLHQMTANYLSEFDRQNGQVHDAGYVFPYTAYEGGQAELGLQVSSITQSLTPTVTLISMNSGSLAPSDYAQFSIVLKGNGSIPLTGGYTLTVDGSSSQEGYGSIADGVAFPLTLGSNWTPGTHTVQVTYNGDDNYKPAASAAATFSAVLPGFTLAAAPSTLTIASGGSGSIALTVNAGPTYAGSTTFQLALLSYTGAAFSGCFGLSSSETESQRGTPTSDTLTLYSGTSQCSTSNHIGALSAALSAALPAALPAVPGEPRSSLLPVSFASLCIAGCFAFRRRKLAWTFLTALVSAALLSASGCGGSSGGGGGGGGGTAPTTPAVVGTYVLQVTGISSADRTVAAKTTFTLVVQ